MKNISYFGRSTFGLKEWENDNEGIKGGTIKEKVIELLLAAQKPLHISEISHEVNKCRNTNETSILTNLKIDKNNKFSFYPNQFVGLVDMDYELEVLNSMILPEKGVTVTSGITRSKTFPILGMKNWINVERVIRGMTRKDLAKAMKVPPNTISAIESRRYEASISLAMKIAKYFNKRVDEIFFPTEDDIPKR